MPKTLRAMTRKAARRAELYGTDPAGEATRLAKRARRTATAEIAGREIASSDHRGDCLADRP
jgi:hypothetical protein